MAVIAAFRDGWTALRDEPVLLVAGFAFTVASHLTDAGELVDSPAVATPASVVGLVSLPFVIGGLLGMALEAVRGDGTSLRRFVAAGRAYYGRVLVGTLLFVAIVFGFLVATFPLTVLGFLGLGLVGGESVGPAVPFWAGVAFSAVTVLTVLAAVLFLQFYATAIVVEELGAVAGLKRSVRVVRANPLGVVGFTVLWTAAMNLLTPELLFLEAAREYGLAEYVPVDPGLLPVALVPVGVAVATIASTYLYTVQVAYYLRLVGPTAAATGNGSGDSSAAGDRGNAYPGAP